MKTSTSIAVIAGLLVLFFVGLLFVADREYSARQACLARCPPGVSVNTEWGTDKCECFVTPVLIPPVPVGKTWAQEHPKPQTCPGPTCRPFL